jgi:hypothetical protein
MTNVGAFVPPFQGFKTIFESTLPRAAPRLRRGCAMGYHIAAFQAYKNPETSR